MFINFICKTLPRVRTSVRPSPSLHKLFYRQHHHPLSSSSSSSSSSKSLNECPFIVSYLIDSCGFSPEKALSASNYMNFKTPEKANSVLDFFKNHGFTQTQISNLVRGNPPVLLCDPQKTLLPKLEFFNSIGILRTELPKVITPYPTILTRSLENQIIPSFNFFKTLLQSHENRIIAIKRYAMLLAYDLQTHLSPNIEILREFGVPESNIVFLLTNQPRTFMTDANRFREILAEVKEMGFSPLRLNFVQAIHARRAMSKLIWEKKVEIYKKWGWSEEDIFVAFKKHPGCMMASEDKIMRAMDFLVNKMGWESSLFARRPTLILLSFAKRIVPRCSVYQNLLAKGLIKKDSSFTKLLESPEKQFIDNIMKRYEEEAPELLKLYQEKLDLSK